MSNKHDWFDNFETEPIGGGNPYHRCKGCGISVPELNYALDRHGKWCQYRKLEEQRRKHNYAKPQQSSD